MDVLINKILESLKEGQYICIYRSRLPIIIYKENGKLYEYFYNIFLKDKLIPEELYIAEDYKYKIFDNMSDCMMSVKHDYLEPSLYDAMIGNNKNYYLIKEDVDRYSGRYSSEGFYFVGAVSSFDDYYYLYWNPDTKNFKYKSCVGACEVKESETRMLSEEYLGELRKLVNKKVYDAVFPSSYLQVYY